MRYLFCYAHTAQNRTPACCSVVLCGSALLLDPIALALCCFYSLPVLRGCSWTLNIWRKWLIPWLVVWNTFECLMQAQWIQQNQEWLYSPPKTSLPVSWYESGEFVPDSTTYADETSWYLERPYHTVKAPFGGNTGTWEIVLLNVVPWKTMVLSGFQIQATCVSIADPNPEPCPSATFDHSPCNGSFCQRVYAPSTPTRQW